MSRQDLLFLPGLLCDGRLWRDQADGVADLATPRIADLTLDDTVAGMARRALAAAPDRFALAALSMGGYVAFEILRQAPDRVTRVALFDTSARLDGVARSRQRRVSLASAEKGRFIGVGRGLMPRLIHASHLGGPLEAVIRGMADRVGAEAFARQQQAILTRPDSRPGLGAIRVPTLVAAGDSDQMTPLAEAEAIRDAIPGARLHVLADCGHLPPLEQPAETTTLLRAWLQEKA